MTPGDPQDLPLTTMTYRHVFFYVTRGEEWIVEHNAAALDAIPDPLALVVDIGAHVGFTSLLAAQRGAAVVALEANPWTYGLLVENIRLNHFCAQVQPLQLALAPQDGHLAALQSWGRSLGTTGLCQAEEQPVTGHALTISPATLFAVLPPGQIDLLKMDIEGLEHYVLPLFTPDDWQRIAWVHMEIHDIESPEQKRFHARWGRNIDVAALLRHQGFVPVATAADTQSVWRRIKEE